MLGQVNKMNVNEIVANALLTEFSSNQVYHDDIPEHGEYPMICYKNIGENPVLHADNKLYAKEYIFRITAVTFGNSSIESLKTKIYNCMTEADFMWITTGTARDGKEYYTSLDFSYGVII